MDETLKSGIIAAAWFVMGIGFGFNLSDGWREIRRWSKRAASASGSSRGVDGGAAEPVPLAPPTLAPVAELPPGGADMRQRAEQQPGNGNGNGKIHAGSIANYAKEGK